MALMVVAAAGTAPGAEPAHPSLVFSSRELPAIQARAADPANAAVWAPYLAAARALAVSAVPLDPAGPPSADGREAPDSARARMLFGHKVGRDLTQWMECLGFAYQITGERAFADKGVQLLIATAGSFPVTQEAMARGFAGGRGDLMRGLAIGYDLFHGALSPDQRRQLRVVADGYVQNFLSEAQDPRTWWYGVHNFNGVCGGGAGLLCLTLRDQDPAIYGRQLDQCVAVLRRWLGTSFDAEGAYSEGIGYSQYGLSNTLLFARALKRAGGPDLFAEPALRQVSRFYAASLLPGEPVMDARNDSMYVTAGLECLLLAAENRDGLARWLYDRRGGPLAPWDLLIAPDTAPQTPTQAGMPLAAHFAGRGLAGWRTGWEASDWAFSIEAGRYYPITHNQADKGHFTLYGRGYRWAVDPGYGNDRQAPLSRCHTLAHNSILVDGQGQAPSGSGLGTDGRILCFADRPDYGYALADCTAAYNANTRGTPGPGVDFARRHALFVRPADAVPAYALVLDDIAKGDTPHEFTWQMLTWSTMQVTAGQNGFVIQPRGTESNAWVTTPAAASGKGTCTWTAEVPKAQTYRLWARVRAGGAEVAKSDSFVVRVGDAPPVEWHMPGSREWTWGAVTHGPRNDGRLFELPAGPCEVTFETREPEAELDAAALVPVADPDPSDNGLPSGLLRLSTARVAAPMVLMPDRAPRPRLAVLLSAMTAVRCGVDCYAPADGRQPAVLPRLRAVATAANPRFVAVLAPWAEGEPEPVLQVERDAAVTTIRVDWGAGTRDTFTWDHDGVGTVAFQRRR